MQRVFMAPVLRRDCGHVIEEETGQPPKGFVGVVLVFDSEESAAAWSLGADPIMTTMPDDEPVN